MITKNYLITLLSRKKAFFFCLLFALTTAYSHDVNSVIHLMASSGPNAALEIVQQTQSLNFSENSLTFNGQQGAPIASQTVTLTASEGAPSITLSEDPDASEWLILPKDPGLGELSFGIKENLPAGTYSTTVFAIDQPDQGYANAQLSISVTISDTDGSPSISANIDELIFETVTNDQANKTDTKQLIIKNTGSGTLVIQNISISGNFASQFNAVTNATNQSIAAGASRTFAITYAPDLNDEDLGYQNAQLTVTSNAINDANLDIGLYALKKSGLEDQSEPTLQAVVNTLGIGIDVGWTTLADGTETVLKGDEVFVQKWKKANSSPINITPVARYSPQELLPFGWYTTGGGEIAENQVGALANGLLNAQRLYPPLDSGETSFDPADAEFGIYVYSNSFNRFNYTEDGLNENGNTLRRARTYPVKDREGNVVDNSYLITFEDASNGDYQDYMFVIDNVSPVALRPIISLNDDEFVGDAITTGNATASKTFSITNTGNSILSNIGSSITGSAAQQFTVNNLPGSLGAGQSADFQIVFNPAANGPQFASATFSGTNAVSISIPLKGLGKAGTGGTNEPSLQWVLDTQLGEGTIDVGDTDSSTNLIDLPAGSTYNSLLGDEIDAQVFQRANEQPVSIDVLSTFGPEDNDPVVSFGWYTTGNASQTNEIAQITNANGNGQRLNPDVEGNLTFNSASENFGFYSSWPYFDNRTLYSEDALNTFEDAIPHHVRVYKLPGEENTYIIATEEHITGYDYQDLVLLVRNIEPVEVEADGLKVNFSDAATAAPNGYLKDSGSSYGYRGNGNNYGWLNASDNTPADVSKNARNRQVNGVSVLQNTLIHMQYGSFSSDASTAYLPDAKWEIELPNGTYEVTVGVGDPTVTTQSNQIPSHTINAESTTIIDNFVPSGAQGSSTRFTTASKVVAVQDGRLTLTPTGGFNTKINFVEVKPTTKELPYFTDVTPVDMAEDVAIRNFQITVGLLVPDGYELDKNTTAGNVQLLEVTSSGEEILLPSNANDTGGGDAITLTPKNQLKEFTTYIYRLTNIEANRIDDLNDRLDFIPFESTFTTGALEDVPTPSRDLSGVKFTKVLGGEGLGEGTVNQLFSSLVVGPDGKLYASTLGDFESDGTIQRWDIKADGTLTNLEVLRPNLQGAPHPETGANNNNDRIIIGLVFDPASTADNLIAYITHSMASVTNGPEWDGVVTKLTGPKLSNVQDIVIHLPRSIKDHLTNSMVFDNKGIMYISQGSNSAGGAPDSAWGQRKERLLSGAILRLDFSKLPAALPLDAYTTDNIDIINSAPSNRITMSDGSYNPYATTSPLTIFATGTRNTYDLLWHSNGWLYMPTNGTAGNNINSPITPSTSSYKLARRIDGRTSVTSAPQIRGGETQKDWLFKTRGGTYHGHPNPYRGEFILNHGGLPYSGLPGQSESSYIDVEKYPRALGPDANYMEPAYDFGLNKSPNGVIEYKGDAFGGRLAGLIMVVRFSGQDDLLVMDPASNGDIDEVYLDIPGLSGFDDPLDVTEDLNTGNLYVSEYDRDQDGVARLTLLRADDPESQQPEITTSSSELLFETVINDQGAKTQTKQVTITNTGLAALEISSITISGNFASQFNALENSGAQTIAASDSLTLAITYAPDINSDNLGYQNAQIIIASNSEENPEYTIGLYGLKKQGYEDDLEPALQDIVNTLGIGVDVGWTSLTTATSPTLQGDEVQFSQWIQATDTPVTITPVGRYSDSEALPFGWFTSDQTLQRNQIGILADGIDNAQRLYPPVTSGDTVFNPQGSLFGIYVFSKSFNRYSYSQDSLNTEGVVHRVRSYPVKDRAGNQVENKYLLTFEDAANGDYQDYMFILNNVIPFDSGALSLSFDKETLSYVSLPKTSNPPAKEVTLSANGFVNNDDIQLTKSQPWVILPQDITLDTPLEIGINTQNLTEGKYSAIVTAKADNYKQATFTINVNVTTNLDYTYEFNFQNLNLPEPSPQGYTDDFGLPYNGQRSTYGDLTFGWVQPNTLSPASAVVNGRNRNTGVDDNVLLKTFTEIGHRDENLYPTLDWVLNVPNGSYAINVSVGDPDFSDSNHVLDVNGETVISFDQQNNNPNDLTNFESLAEVTVTDGILRLSLGDGGVNVKVNYIRIAPLEAPQTPPQITATFDGVENERNNYRGNVGISLAAQAVTDGTSISSLSYSLDGATYQTYTAPIVVNTQGDHVLLVQAQDGNGVTVINTYYFSVAPASNALLYVENMTKIPGTDQGYPADDYYSFYRIGNPGQAITHDSNVLRINNTGTENLIVSDITISDTRYYTFDYINGDGTNDSLPLTIPPGEFVDLNIRLIGSTTNGNNKIFKESISIETNADNSSEYVSTLHGGFAPQPENPPNQASDEINAQEVFNAFGYRTNMRSIVNDQGTITPPNPAPTRPSSNAPNADNINAGYEGDMILAQSFVQADASEPIRVMQLSAFHGYTPGTLKFISVNGTGTVGGISATHINRYYQTLLPENSNGDINNDAASRITTPFRIAVENYLNTGGNDLRGTDPAVLGLRVYKVVNRDGEVVPNQYIVLQDYVQSGCGAGSANCDWNDNTFLIMNIRPQEQPSVSKIAPYYAYKGENFSYGLENSFLRGYPGNKFSYEAVATSGSKPAWLSFDPETGIFSGRPPEDALDSYTFTITATDLNGIVLTEEFTLFTLDRADPNDFALRINAGGPTLTYDGRQFVSDRYYSDGGTYTNTRAQIPDLYKSERSDSPTFGYTIPVPDDYNYRVTLHFAEIYWGATGGGPGGTGKRIFDVSVQDSLVLDNYDITADVGAQTPVVKTYEIAVRDGIINIDLSALASDGGVDFPMLSALEIRPLDRINSGPDAVITATPTTGAAPLEVDFMGSESTDDIEVNAYEWMVGDEVVSDEADFQYTFDEIGTYTVTLTVTDAEGLSDTASVDIQVTEPGENAAPVAVATVSPETGNAPLDVIFTGSNSADDQGIATYEWAINDSIVSTQPDFPYIFNEAGNYSVRLTVTDEQGLSDSQKIDIKISSATGNNPPDAVATADVSSGIAPLAVVFTGSNSIDDVAIESYVWRVNDSIVSTEADFEYVFEDATNYDVTLTVTDGEGLTDTASLIIIASSPDGNTAPNAVASANVLKGPMPLEVTFTGSKSTDDQGIASYEWQVEGETVSTQANFVYTFEQAGNYAVTLIVTDAQGLADRVTVNITVTTSDGNEPPKAVITASEVKGNAPLEVTFTGSNSTDDVAIVSYEWILNGNVISEDANFTYTFTEEGSYEVRLTVIDAQGLTDTETVTIQVGQDGPVSVIIYPNPATTQMTIQMKNAPAKVETVTIVDARGRTIHTYNPSQDQEETVYNLQLPILAAGMYVVVIEDAAGNEYIERLIIRNY